MPLPPIHRLKLGGMKSTDRSALVWPRPLARRLAWHLCAVTTGALAATLLLAGCSAKNDDDASPSPAAALVQVARVADTVASEWSGVARSREGATLAFSVPGRIRIVHADLGDQVQAGEVLMALDAEPFQLQLRQAEAEDKASAPALAEARRRMESEQRLWQAGATSQAEYEAVLSAHAAAAARSETAAANLALARRAMRESRLAAPTAGRLARRLVPAGTFVDAGTPVLEFDSTGTTEIVLAVPASHVAGLAAGQVVEVRSQLTAAAPVMEPGTITHVGQRSLAGGIHEVILRLPETTAVRPGEPVLARLPSGAPREAVRLPATAVQRSIDGSTAVLIVTPGSNVVRRREVRIASPLGADVILAEGVQAGEVVVATGASFLREGQTIRRVMRE